MYDGMASGCEVAGVLVGVEVALVEFPKMLLAVASSMLIWAGFSDASALTGLAITAIVCDPVGINLAPFVFASFIMAVVAALAGGTYVPFKFTNDQTASWISVMLPCLWFRR